MAGEKNLILDKQQILQKIKRIAFEIYEHNFSEAEIVLAGIEEKGYIFAHLLKNEIESISPIKVLLVKVQLDKLASVQSEVLLDTDISALKNKTVILIDDVLNTGRTLAYALKPFLNIELNKLQTAVIVDRSHQLFPIAADYVGYALATTLKERIEVVLEDHEFGVYLH
jgi:pyrimidine operon attenuation protein/uracil phosphoribosyltransferase